MQSTPLGVVEALEWDAGVWEYWSIAIRLRQFSQYSIIPELRYASIFALRFSPSDSALTFSLIPHRKIYRPAIA